MAIDRATETLEPASAWQRLASRRDGVVLGLAAVLAVYLLAGLGWPVPVLGCAAILAAALLVPSGQQSSGPPIEAKAQATASHAAVSADDLAAAIHDPLIIFDRAGGLVQANDAARAAFGALDPGMSLLVKFRAPEMQQAVDRVRTGASQSASVDLIERVPVERSFRASLSAIGSTGLFVLTFKDQSEARRIDRMRADFIANASHELRTPLASIAGFVETLRGPARNDPAARERFLGIMQNQTGRMARLIDDLLSLSRLEMKALVAADAQVDIRAVLQAVTDTLSPLAAETSVVIERNLGDEPVDVRGDRDELFQVFENLLENACKYGASGGRVAVSLAVQGDGANREAAVTVRDFGPGIAPEHIPRITERFYRADVETSRAQKGTGLGLSIVKHILTRHRARLSIRSDVGQGAAFTVTLPLA